MVDGPLPDTDDYGDFLFTSLEFLRELQQQRCITQQAAVQYLHREDWPQTRYLFDKFLFAKMASDGQAGLILHEAIYTDLIVRLRNNTSTVARLLTALISSLPDKSDLTESGITTLLMEVLARIQHPAALIQGVLLDLTHPLRRFPGSKMESAVAMMGFPLELNGNVFPLDGPISFYDDGHVKTITLLEQTPVSVPGNQIFIDPNHVVRLHRDGSLLSAVLADDRILSLKGKPTTTRNILAGSRVILTREGLVELVMPGTNRRKATSKQIQ